jgi:NADH-quinone oxidoreductase subunit N
MNFVVPDFSPAAAEIFIAIMTLIIMMLLTFFRRNARSLAYFFTQATLLATAMVTLLTMNGEVTYTFSNQFVDDLMGDFLKLMIYFSMFVALLYGRDYLVQRRLDRPEYYLLVLLMTLGMMVMVSANHFLSLYMGLEMMSLCLYAMVAFDRDSARSTEAAMKYFVLGALASGLLLYGMSMIYGATGTLELSAISQSLYQQNDNRTILLFGLVFIVAGLAFKLGVVPFHMWVPDVYHGAPTAVTLIIASAPKLAAFAITVRLLISGLFEVAEHWQSMLIFLSVASLVLGNLAAIAQTNIKRMLAYSGISHMGFMLLGLLAGVVEGERHFAFNAYSSAMFYAATYVIMSLASFGMLLLLSRSGFEAERLDDLKGLNQRSPWFAFMMLITLFSMAGVPPFIGFFAKLSVLQAVVAAGYVWLAVLAVIMSLIGAFYYLRVVKLMYFDRAEDDTPIQAPVEFQIMLSANGLGILLLGLAPQALMSVCAYALLASL